LVPAQDWQPLAVTHAKMAAFRAIESGFSLFRVTGDGFSHGFDHQGRALAMMDWFATETGVVFAEVPIAKVSTVYSVIKDLFSWSAMLGFVAVVILALRRSRSFL
jgi:apolipoprotein N-acyltransferase